MKEAEIARKLAEELLFGAPDDYAHVFNPGTPGLLDILDQLGPGRASRVPEGFEVPIAAHAHHIALFLGLLVRLAGGEADPFATADWDASWRTGSLDAPAWKELRGELRATSRQWVGRMAATTRDDAIYRENLLASLPHLAYHLGAIRQMLKVV